MTKGPHTMTKDELLELADRCEREQRNYALDRDIERAIHAGGPFPITTPPYTTSLDAAVTLVPEGMVAAVIHYVPQLDPKMPASGVARVYNDDWESGRCTGRTAAAALTAAALRARASLTEE